MISEIKSSFVLHNIFSFIDISLNLKIINYNKLLQKKLSINKNKYRDISKKYRIGGRNGLVKEYLKDTDDLIFEGEVKDGKKDGLGKEYDIEGNIIFEGEYKNGKKNGHGKKYSSGKLVFDGIYLDGKEWNGNCFNLNFGKFTYEGLLSEGKRNGNGKEYKITKTPKTDFYKDKIGLNDKKYIDSNLLLLKEEDQCLNEERLEKNKDSLFLEEEEDQCSNKERSEEKGEDLSEDNNSDSKSDKSNGKRTEYFENNTIVFDGNYFNGKKEGDGIEYYQNGKIKFKGEFSEGGKKNGKWYN